MDAPGAGRPRDAQMFVLWLVSGVTYVLGAGLTALLPLPRFGFTPAFIASLQLSGGGEWIERPYTVLAFGLLYFAVQAFTKYAMAGSPEPEASTPVADAASRTQRISRLVGSMLQKDGKA